MSRDAIAEIADEVLGAARDAGTLRRMRLLDGAPQPSAPGLGFQLFRIGDAVSSRNIHAAVLDAFRLCRAL